MRHSFLGLVLGLVLGTIVQVTAHAFVTPPPIMRVMQGQIPTCQITSPVNGALFRWPEDTMTFTGNIMSPTAPVEWAGYRFRDPITHFEVGGTWSNGITGVAPGTLPGQYIVARTFNATDMPSGETEVVLAVQVKINNIITRFDSAPVRFTLMRNAGPTPTPTPTPQVPQPVLRVKTTTTIGPASGTVELLVQDVKRRQVGLSTPTVPLQHSFVVQNGTVSVLEGNQIRKTTTAPPNTRLTITVGSGVVSYAKNGLVYYTSPTPLSTPAVIEIQLEDALTVLGRVTILGGQ